MNKRISFRLVGRDEDGGHVRFDEFIKQLGAVRKALSETDRIVSEKSSVYFKVVGLQHNSPALIEIEAVSVGTQSNASHEVVKKFVNSLEEIKRNKAPVGFDLPALQAFKEMTSLIGKGIQEFDVLHDENAAVSVPSLSHHVDEIVGPDEYETGSVTGTLEQINVHANQNVFTIYPTLKQYKLRCVFPDKLRAKAVSAVDHYVKVYGVKKFKPYLKRGQPYEIVVKDIEIYPPDDELPTFSSLRGLASGTGSNEASEETIRRVRHEW